MLKISNFKHLQNDRLYRVFDAAGNSQVLVFQSWYEEDGLIFIVFCRPDSELVEIWAQEDFLQAIDDRKAQTAYKRFCQSVADEMFRKHELMLAISHAEQALSSLVETLYNAGKSFRDFKSDLEKLLVIPDEIKEKF
ncbi:hypothetical protein [Paenibacillus campinasensis]|uniref:Uncharacterized protein n=1 Tax=Paenibacillus campinasensis TaxID=66347 RepID=A0A268EI77_9BACL|nr:hypothetical protein [Paenibacillus campinasensis]PAD72837.1 hypothetical protein CHH67_21250 [Paenibacillus campinasensis]